MANRDKPSIADKLKEGVSVDEMQHFFRKYLSESFIILAIIIATISSTFDFFMKPGWSLFMITIGAVISIGLPDKTHFWQRKWFIFLHKQEKFTQIIIGSVRLAVALFIPMIIFAELGLLSGIAFHEMMKEIGISAKSKDIDVEDDDDHV